MAEETTIDKKQFSLTTEKAWGALLFVIYMVYEGTNRLNATNARIEKLESAPAQVMKLQSDQQRSEQDLRDLKGNFDQLKKSVEEVRLNQEKIASSLEGLNAQVGAIRAALPQPRNR